MNKQEREVKRMKHVRTIRELVTRYHDEAEKKPEYDHLSRKEKGMLSVVFEEIIGIIDEYLTTKT